MPRMDVIMRETRRLWRRRILVIAALVCACLIGIGVMLAGRQYNVGIGRPLRMIGLLRMTVGRPVVWRATISYSQSGGRPSKVVTAA